MGRKSRMPGLRLRGNVWHIEKRCKYSSTHWIRESTGFTEYEEAEGYLIRKLLTLKDIYLNGSRPKVLFNEAAGHYLIVNKSKLSIQSDVFHLKTVMPFIGHLYLEQVHDNTLLEFIEARKLKGIKSKSINLVLGIVRRILNLSSNSWRHDNGLTWLENAPKITMLKVRDQSRPYPLDWNEQTKLFKELPSHLAEMSLYKVNTGTREQEVCNLKWDWEIEVAEIGTSVFIVPFSFVKNGEDRLVIHNSIASSIIQNRRNARPDSHVENCGVHIKKGCNCSYSYVFTYKERKVNLMHNSAWKRAWKESGLPTGKCFVKGVL